MQSTPLLPKGLRNFFITLDVAWQSNICADQIAFAISQMRYPLYPITRYHFVSYLSQNTNNSITAHWYLWDAPKRFCGTALILKWWLTWSLCILITSLIALLQIALCNWQIRHSMQLFDISQAIQALAAISISFIPDCMMNSCVHCRWCGLLSGHSNSKYSLVPASYIKPDTSQQQRC